LDADNIRKNLDMDEELCACFVDWMKAFDRVNWTKLILILKETCYRPARKKIDQQIVPESEC